MFLSLHLDRIFIAVLFIIMSPIIAARAWSAEPAFSGALEMTIDAAIAQNFKGGAQEPKLGRGLELLATCEAGTWTEAWGYSKNFNASIHLGQVTSGTVTAGTIQLKLTMTIARDNWISGGVGEYELTLTRRGDRVSGTASGFFQGDGAQRWEVKDAVVTGTMLPANPVRPGYVPVRMGEHPRLLFRSSDLPALRARAETAFGRAVITELKAANDPVSLGVLYQLTGDRAYAERAFPATVEVMSNRNGGAFALGRFWGYRTMVVSNAYDLCYGAWTETQKDMVENYLDDIVDLCLNRKHRVGTVNWSPGSNYTVVINSGNGAAALALWGERSPAPVAPVAPRLALAELRADAALVAGKGVPVIPLPVDRSPTEWLWSGAFQLNAGSGDDCLASIGGSAKARPEVGTEVHFKDQVQRWMPISLAANPDYIIEGKEGVESYGIKPGQIGLRTPILAGGEHKRLFFYAVIENPTAGYYRFKANAWNGTCYIGGERFVDGEVVQLAAGRYPFMVPVVVGSPTGTAAPWFIAASATDAAAYYADQGRQKAYLEAHDAWGKSMAAWTANKGVNQTWLRNVRVLAACNYLDLQRGMGDGGFQGEGEGYTIECHHMPHDFANIYQNVYGRSLTGRPSISHFAPRYVHDAFWDGAKVLQQSYGGHGGGTLPPYYFARAIALVPEAWRPVMHDHWLRLAGVTHAQVVDGTGVPKLCAQRAHDDVLTPMWTFLNYPLEQQPNGPEGILPKAWAAPTRGYYSFRNGWNGSGDILASIYAKAGVSNGWNQAEAGCFQIFGLGTEWAYKSNDASGKNGSRWLDNVVMLPDDPINANARATVQYAALEQQHGGGVVTIDMDPIYQLVDPARIAKVQTKAKPAPKASKGKPASDESAQSELPPNESTPAASAELQGIHGVRSFAVDYSGAAGVPGLFAVVDRITGGKRKVWVFQPPRNSKTTLAIAGNSFTLSQGDRSLKATFIGAEKVEIAHASGMQKAHPASGIADVESSAIHATVAGGTGGDFFVIMTLQQGTAPPIAVTGIGLDAVATVGAQTIRFDGKNLVIGPQQ